MDNGGFYVTTRKTFVTLQELVAYYSGMHFYNIFKLIYVFLLETLFLFCYDITFSTFFDKHLNIKLVNWKHS